MSANIAKGCWKRSSFGSGALDRYVYTPAFDKQSVHSHRCLVPERRWVDSLLSNILPKEQIRGSSNRPASATASVYGARVAIPRHRRRPQTAISDARVATASPAKQVEFAEQLEDNNHLESTPEEHATQSAHDPEDEVHAQPTTPSSQAEEAEYADDTFEADAEGLPEDHPHTAEIGVNTEDVFQNHPEIRELVKQAEADRPVSAPAGYARKMPLPRPSQSAGGSHFTASWGVDSLIQDRKLKMRNGELARHKVLKDAAIREKNKRTPVWDFSTTADVSLRASHVDPLARPLSPWTQPTSPPPARPNSGASYASGHSTAPGNVDASLHMSTLGSPESPGKHSKALAEGLRAPVPAGSADRAEKIAEVIRRQDRYRKKCESARLRKEDEKRRSRELAAKRSHESKLERSRHAENEEQRRQRMMAAEMEAGSDKELPESWPQELRIVEHSKSLAHSLGFRTRGFI